VWHVATHHGDCTTGPDADQDGGADVLHALYRLDEIPGLGGEAAATGLDMTCFPTPEAVASRAGSPRLRGSSDAARPE
jgi:hypothetical protein